MGKRRVRRAAPRPPSRGRGPGPCRRRRHAPGSGRRRRRARTAARSTGRADPPAGRRSGHRRGPSGRPRRGASPRRRPGARRSRDLDVLEAGFRQGIDQPIGRRPAIGGVLRQGGDAGDPKECLVGLESRVAGRVAGVASNAASGLGMDRIVGTATGWESNERTVAGPLVSLRCVVGRSGRLRVRIRDRLAGADDRRSAVLVQLGRQVAEEGFEALTVNRSPRRRASRPGRPTCPGAGPGPLSPAHRPGR